MVRYVARVRSAEIVEIAETAPRPSWTRSELGSVLSLLGVGSHVHLVVGSFSVDAPYRKKIDPPSLAPVISHETGGGLQGMMRYSKRYPNGFAKTGIGLDGPF